MIMMIEQNVTTITITTISHLPLQRELGANENLVVGAGLRSRVCQVPSHPLQLDRFLLGNSQFFMPFLVLGRHPSPIPASSVEDESKVEF